MSDEPTPFERALERNIPVRAVGDVRLRYDSGLLIGELRKRPTKGLADAVLILTVGLGSIDAWLALGPGPLWAAAGLAGVTLGLAVWTSVLERRAAVRRRFVLNFQTETLRLDFADARTGSPRTEMVPFDDVEKVVCATGRKGKQELRVHYRVAEQGTKSSVLVSDAGAREVLDLQRVERLLRNALLSKQPVAAGGEHDRTE
jgi:hypothetical protein